MNKNRQTPNPPRPEDRPGFYDGQFTKEELDDLKMTHRNNLEGEIDSLRALVRRLIERTNEERETEMLIKLSKAISTIDKCISNLVEKQEKLSGGENAVDFILQNVAIRFENDREAETHLAHSQYPLLGSEG
jgi:hypothetical protein